MLLHFLAYDGKMSKNECIYNAICIQRSDIPWESSGIPGIAKDYKVLNKL